MDTPCTTGKDGYQSMKPYRGIIFDFDGTLIDTSRGIFNAIEYATQQMGLDSLPEKTMQRFIGPPLLDSYMRYFSLSEEAAQDAIAHHRSYQKEHAVKGNALYPGMLSLLEKLKEEGYALAVATMKGHEVTLLTLAYEKIDSYFEAVCGVTDEKTTDKMGLYTQVMQKLKLEPEDCLIIGDAKFDGEAANALGADFLAVSYGFGFAHEKDAQVYDPIAYVHTPSDIYRILLERSVKEPFSYQAQERKSGVLMPISALPGPYGIGTFSLKEAEPFIKKMSQSGFRAWQILPLTIPDFYNSPYASESAFAGNPMFIDPETLHLERLITDEELQSVVIDDPYTVAYQDIYEPRQALLLKAYRRLKDVHRQQMASFYKHNKGWLEDYAAYATIKSNYDGLDWINWPDTALKNHEKKAVQAFITDHQDTFYFYIFVQWLFSTQWQLLKSLAHAYGIALIGDMPFYLLLDSADVWANRKYFDIDRDGLPKQVAGVPPDYYSEDGQLWGNPLYDWKAMKNNGYRWWQQRFAHMLELYDVVRIDHFRAFADFWAVPAGEKTARKGKWVQGPGLHFFESLWKELPCTRDNLIAENLGVSGKALRKLMRETGLPDMRVLQFAFLDEHDDSTHYPHNHSPLSVAYSGTHDNNTALGWLQEMSADERTRALGYFGFDASHWGEGGAHSPVIRSLLRTLWQSPAKTVIVPVQDLLGYGSDTRFNTPGVCSDQNWSFRLTREAMESIDWQWLQHLNTVMKRLAKQ